MSRAPDSGDAAAALDVLTFAIGVLAGEPDPRAQVAAAAIGAVITGEAVDLFAYIANADNLPGHSLREDATVARRNRLLCDVSVPLRQLATEYDRYRSGPWLRDRTLTGCPYGADDRRSTYFLALKLVDRPLGERQLRRIIL